MAAIDQELNELLERIGKLTPDQQLMLVQELLGNIRDAHFGPTPEEHAARQRRLDEFTQHYVANRGWEWPDGPAEQSSEPHTNGAGSSPCGAAKSTS